VVCWRGGYCEYFLPTKSPRDSKHQLRTVTWLIHRWKCRRNHQGIQNDSSVRWCALFIVRLADGIVPSVKPSAKVNISPLQRPSPPLFLLLLPHLNSPQLQTTTPPPKKNLPLLSTTSYISWSLLIKASVFWFTDEFLSVFVSDSISLNFNILMWILLFF
jgi:hypothetical protein